MKPAYFSDLPEDVKKAFNCFNGKFQQDKTFFAGEHARARRNEQTYDGFYAVHSQLNKGADTRKIYTRDEDGRMFSAETPNTAPRYGVEYQRRTSEDRLTHLLASELIEATIDTTIPVVKVSAKNPDNQVKAMAMEDYLRNVVDRIQCEEQNDISERVVPTCGAGFWLVDWVENDGTGFHDIRFVHLLKIVPQAGIYTNVDDMDRIFVVQKTTRDAVERKYGLDIINSAMPAEDGANTDIVEIVICFFRNDGGGIGKISWAGNAVLEYYDEYYARRQSFCAECGAVLGIGADRRDGCPVCGSDKRREGASEFEVISADVVMPNGTVIPAGTRVPYYTPKSMPVIAQKNISRPNHLIGDSDAEKVALIQDQINALLDKARDKIALSGALLTLPLNAFMDDGMLGTVKPMYMSVDEVNTVNLKHFVFPIDQELNYAQYLRETAKNVLGVTNVWMGKTESPNMSGKALQTLAGQSAGRMELRRSMKRAAWARIYELLFKYALAFDDDTKYSYGYNDEGDSVERPFSRYYFLEPDGAGGWRWPDDSEYTFSIDIDTPAANNRSALWQNNDAMYAQGMYGQPGSPDSLVMYWQENVYAGRPHAARTLAMAKSLRDKAEEQQETARQMEMAKQAQQMQVTDSNQNMAVIDMLKNTRGGSAERDLTGEGRGDS